MNIYTVLDPDDGSGLTYWWYGDTMVYVHQDRVEVDAYHLETGKGDGAPTLDDVRAEIERRHRER